jgi:hypothetical protein
MRNKSQGKISFDTVKEVLIKGGEDFEKSLEGVV